MLFHQVLARLEVDPESFLVAGESIVRQFAKTTLDARKDAELNEDAAEAATKTASLTLEIGTADHLRCPPDKLPLYQCTTWNVLFFLSSLCQDAEPAASYGRRPLHSCSGPFKSRAREVDDGLFRTADAYACPVTIPPSRAVGILTSFI